MINSRKEDTNLCCWLKCFVFVCFFYKRGKLLLTLLMHGKDFLHQGNKHKHSIKITCNMIKVILHKYHCYIIRNCYILKSNYNKADTNST